MLLSSLLTVPIIGTVVISSIDSFKKSSKVYIKTIALVISVINLAISLVVFILFNNSINQFQYIQEHYNIQLFDIYLGIDGISIYFILLTTIIMPIVLLSNWDSIKENEKSYLIIMLLLETLLLAVFMSLDIILFYIFFESILPPAMWCWVSSMWDKLPNNGNFLKFLIPNYVWKYVSGWSNYSGMVTSQKINENEMENRVSKSIVDEKTIVKEQRVDGSCINLLMLRCTLKGFERDYQIRTPSNQINLIRLYSTVNTYEVKSQGSFYILNPYFVTGFTVFFFYKKKIAEGSFIVRIRKNPKTKSGWSVETKFSICIHKKDIAVLKLFQNYFGGVGSFTKASKETIHYRVASLQDLTNVIIPHFEKYPLITQKKADFLLFKDIVNLMNNKEHLTIEGLQKIVGGSAY